MNSLKYKILISISLIPIVCVAVYFLLAKSIFKEDKLAYIFESNISNASLVASSINEVFLPIKMTMDMASKAKLNFSEVASHLLSLKGVASVSLADLQGNLTQTLNANKTQVELQSFPQEILSKQNNFFIYKYKMVDQYALIAVSEDTIGEKLSLIPFDQLWLKNKKGKILLETNSEFGDADSLRTNLSQIDEKRATGAFAKLIGEETSAPYVETVVYNSLYDFTIHSLYSWDKAMLPVKQLVRNSTFYLITIICLAVFLGLFLSVSLTNNLNKLKTATELISNENYDIDLNIHSKDEVGKLATSFITMATKIKSLLAELRKYNLHLEELVAERTKELKLALDLQHSMMDSVDQGFAIFDQNAKLTGRASEQFYKHFNLSAKDSAADIMQLLDVDFDMLAGIVFSGNLPFEDAVGLLPNHLRLNDKDIRLNYFAFNQDDKLQGLVFVSTDITAELKALREKELEQSKAKIVYQIVMNKNLIKNVLIDSQKVTKELGRLEIKLIDDYFQLVHTVKARALMGELTDLGDILHGLEDELGKIRSEKNITKEGKQIIKDECEKIKVFINKFFSEFGVYLNAKNLDELDRYHNLIVDQKSWREFLQQVNIKDKNIANDLYDLFYLKDISELLKGTEEFTLQLSKRHGKQLVFDIDPAAKIYLNKVEDLQKNLVHLFNNIVVHGVETPEIRKQLGKSEQGKISITSKISDHTIKLLISDDGSGIDLEKIKLKLEQSGMDTNKLSDKELINSIFSDGFSTQEVANSFAGRGVGMSAVKAAVEELKGTIEVSSTLGKGVNFEINLPEDYFKI